MSGGGEGAEISVLSRNSTSFDRSIEDLEDNLLIEILCRTPTTRFAFRCKSVSKRWCSLISSPYFGSRFVDVHAELLDDYESSESQKNLGMLATHLNPAKDSCMVSVASKNPIFNLPGFDLGFLPVERDSVTVVASCNDLILCQAGKKREIKSYYLCNPFTRDWVPLPPPSIVPENGVHQTMFGLVCESYCDRRAWGKIVDFEFRYRVVRFYYREDIHKHAKQLRFCSETEIPHMAERFLVETYYSESGEWIQSELLGGEFRFASQTVAYNGKLHWISLCGRHLVTYDPFDMGRTTLIDGPHFSLSTEERQRLCRFHVGECKGVLRVMRMRLGYECCLMSGSFSLVSKDLSVWDLGSDQMGRRSLRLKHKATFDTIVSYNPWTREISRPCAGDLAFHPWNEDVVYLWYSESGELLVSYDMETGGLKLEGRFKSGTCYPNSCEVFPLVLPLWPTPIPSTTTSQELALQFQNLKLKVMSV